MSQAKQRDALLNELSQLDGANFERLALDIFRYQAQYNAVYAQFLTLLGTKQDRIGRLTDIPCLPIALFKTHLIQTGTWRPQQIFSSSGTTGASTSRHALRDEDLYRRHARRAFETFYGPLTDYCVLALLPSYLERSGSSLVYMAADFIERSSHPASGFFLDDYPALFAALDRARADCRKPLLLGVSFALLDLAERYPQDLSDTVIMETGGMKGRRRELTREELHVLLCDAFQAPAIHSEYGMTELLSQAYSRGGGDFRPAPTLQILIRDVTDPFHYLAKGRAGAVNLIDLANLDTISFIASDDLGRRHADGSFAILGRLDNSDMRGCNLLVGS